MAAASPSPLVSSVEKTNGAKLSRLLIDGGTMVLRKIFDRYHPPANLLTDLNANYHTLNNLLRRRVLHKPQWNLLFPPGGATPDSNTFDITLLFLLLTNICGLSPPLSGWHTKPFPSDTSVEANLARIKFFRNDLYGHVTTTGIDTPTFSALWLEISAVLVALGLPQVDIDRLKAEHCGEEDFIDVLFEWADSEEDIKSQLKDIRQFQAKTGQTVDEVRQTQIEDRTILQDNKVKLEEVHEVQTETQHTVDEVRQTQIEDRKILQDNKRKLEEVYEVQTETQHTADEVLQTQIEDQKILQDSKRKLEEVHEVQTETQHTVDEVRQTQIEDQKILQDNKRKLEEVYEVQIETQHTADEVRQTQIEDQKILQDSKRKLEEVHEVQTETQHTVDEVRQTQIEDQKILQDNKRKLEEVYEVQIETQHTADEVRQTQIEDQKILQDSKRKLEEVHEVQTETQHTVDEVRQTQLEDQKRIQDIKAMMKDVLKCQSVAVTKKSIDKKRQTQLGDRETVRENKVDKKLQDHVEVQRGKSREIKMLKRLAKIETLKNIRYHADRYVEGTRLSIFSKVDRWLNDRSSPNRVIVISGNAGMGKSVISAVMCEKMQEAGQLAGCHFCQHGKARHRNPKVMLQSLASQLCDVLPDYKKALVEKLSRNLGVEINDMEVKDLFEVLFEEPLTSLNDPGLTYLMVIDGLDESEFQGRNELLDVIANYFQGLPLWIRFLVTTRPEINIADNLNNLHPLQLDPNVEENVKDIYLCFEKQISHLLQSEHRENILQTLVQKSEGVMLYAYYLMDFIKKKVSLLTPELLDSILPTGISSVYHSYFKRLETELCKELEVTEEQFLNFLSAVATAREPLPLGSVSKLLLPGKSTSVVQRKINAAIACVSALLPVQDECIHFFHKSVKDWLIDKSNYGQHHFSVAEKEGHEVLSKLCINELDEVKRKGVDFAQFSDTTKYALQHGVQHMLQLEDARVCSLEEVVKRFILDIELVYAKLCVNVTAASEDILCVQKHAGVKSMFEGCHRALDTLLHLLRKHISILTTLPRAIFQCLLNEAGPELSFQASVLLETKYSEIPYMEYLHKEDLQARVQTKFVCSAEVACFDVSPQLDYMVCECIDNTIQLWSLHTGKQLWKRVLEETKYYDTLPIFEDTFPLSALELFHRSVVFHPTEDFVLPGILSHAYSFHGDLKPLYLSSKCRFSVCSVSADKTKMLASHPRRAKSIIMWSLTDGSEISHFSWNDYISSFAWSLDGRLLAFSDYSRSVYLVDVMDSFTILAQATTSGAFGAMKFSPDCRSLYCLHFEDDGFDLFRVHVHMKIDGNFSLDVFNLPDEAPYHPWEFESRSEPGFLLGDPFCFSPERNDRFFRPALAFVLNEQSVLTVCSHSNIIEMLYLDGLTKGSVGDSDTIVQKAAFSLNGDKLYVVTVTGRTLVKLMAWDIARGMLIAGKCDFEDRFSLTSYDLVTVRAGVLLQTSFSTLELWNFNLSECIRSWSDFGDIYQVTRISEERVACDVLREVIILDTTREGIVSTVTFHGSLVTCTSKGLVITTDDEVRMQCGDVVLWKMFKPLEVSHILSCSLFSPTEKYCVLAGESIADDEEAFLYVLDAASGRTLHRLFSCSYMSHLDINCNFVSDLECITYYNDRARNNYCVRLFNVKSGDLLSEIDTETKVYSLAACPDERLLAIGFRDSKVNFKVLRVKLPGDKHRRKSKRSGFINKEQKLL